MRPHSGAKVLTQCLWPREYQWSDKPGQLPPAVRTTTIQQVPDFSVINLCVKDTVTGAVSPSPVQTQDTAEE